jgi:hypothetical protein
LFNFEIEIQRCPSPQSLANWSAVAAVHRNGGFADSRKFSRVLANCGYETRN